MKKAYKLLIAFVAIVIVAMATIVAFMNVSEIPHITPITRFVTEFVVVAIGLVVASFAIWVATRNRTIIAFMTTVMVISVIVAGLFLLYASHLIG